MSTTREEDITERAKFYNEASVARMISKNGVPKSRKALEIIISVGSVAKSGITQELVDRLGNVIFSSHPQQINVRDKATGRTIAVIPR